METTTYTAFDSHTLVASAEPQEALRSIRRYLEGKPGRTVLIFDDGSGAQVDFDFRCTERICWPGSSLPPEAGPRSARLLGVVCREVSLLPRYWDLLKRQGNKASAILRRLVDDAIRNEPASARAKRAVEVVDREMWALADDLPGCEKASRVLYARDFARFRALIHGWPQDVSSRLSTLVGRLE